MEEADRTMCEKCMAVNYADAEFCRRCGEPLPQNAPTPPPQESDIRRMAQAMSYLSHHVTHSMS